MIHFLPSKGKGESFKLARDNLQPARKIKEISFLNHLNKTCLSLTNLQELVNKALEEIVVFFHAKGGLVMLVGEWIELVTGVPAENFEQAFLDTIKKKGKEHFFASKAMKTGEDSESCLDFLQGRELGLYFPLKLQDNLQGIMLLYFSCRKNLKRLNKKFLNSIVEQMMIAIERVNRFEQMEKRMEQFSALYNMSHLASYRLEGDFLQQSLPFLATMFETEKAWLMLYQNENLLIKKPYLGLAEDEVTYLSSLNEMQLGFFLAVLDSGQVLSLNNSFPNNLGVKAENLLLIPLKMGSVPIGIIYLANSRKGKFSLMDSQLATSVGIQLAGIWERLKLQERLAQENIKLEAANRLKSQFLANMSHELRTPMNSIIGYTHCLLAGMDGTINQEQRNSLEKILTSAKNLFQLINDILDISKIEANKIQVKIQPFDFLECFNETIIVVEQLAAKKGLTIIKELPAQLSSVWGDCSRVRQILLNLLSNAIKFTLKGNITIKVREKENYLEVDVEDTGIGIKPQALSYIFEEFRQADGSTTREYGGTGLGLAITKKLLELQHGSIRVESQLGKGSVFSFTLPIVKEPEEIVPKGGAKSGEKGKNDFNSRR